MAAIRYLGRDTEEAGGFYVGQLGFTLVSRSGSAFAVVERDGHALWLSGPNTSAAQQLPDGRLPQPGGWNRVVLNVDDVAAEIARLDAAGTIRRSDPVSGPGGTQVLVEDPSGNPIELFTPHR